MKNKEINEHIELARQSGYNEACYLNEKKLKEIEEELIKVFERLKDYFQTFEEDKTKKNYIDLKRDFNFIKLMEDELKQIFAKHTPSGKYKGHTSADDTGGDNQKWKTKK